MDDPYEREAERVAEQVMRMPAPGIQRAPAQIQRAADRATPEVTPAIEGQIQALRSGGQPLDAGIRSFMEPRFGYDFSTVRVHTGPQAARAASSVSALAFTVGNDVMFGAGQYQPGSTAGNRLIAHELTHVVQQRLGQSVDSSTPENPTPRSGYQATIRRKLELRPPGKGETSAFSRAQEFVDRLNTISPAIQYALNGQKLEYTVNNAAALTHFDKAMQDFIDRADLVPMRLITSKGYVGGGPLFADSFILGYVDLDDLLADDIYSFQSDILHFLTERFQVKDYARLIGTNFSKDFKKAHKAGKDAEAAQLRALFNDPSVIFVYEKTKPNNTWVNAFKSKAHGYWVFQAVHHSDRAVAGGKMWVKRKDGTEATIDDFRKERSAGTP